MCLRQEIDGTHILEFHKDERKTDSKGAICMDFCNKVVRVYIIQLIKKFLLLYCFFFNAVEKFYFQFAYLFLL